MKGIMSALALGPVLGITIPWLLARERVQLFKWEVWLPGDVPVTVEAEDAEYAVRMWFYRLEGERVAQLYESRAPLEVCVLGGGGVRRFKPEIRPSEFTIRLPSAE